MKGAAEITCCSLLDHLAAKCSCNIPEQSKRRRYFVCNRKPQFLDTLSNSAHTKFIDQPEATPLLLSLAKTPICHRKSRSEWLAFLSPKVKPTIRSSCLAIRNRLGHWLSATQYVKSGDDPGSLIYRSRGAAPDSQRSRMSELSNSVRSSSSGREAITWRRPMPLSCPMSVMRFDEEVPPGGLTYRPALKFDGSMAIAAENRLRSS